MIEDNFKPLLNNKNPEKREIGQRLLEIWLDFDANIDAVPIIASILKGEATIADYKRLLRNLRAQVFDGGSWISRAASSFDGRSSDLALLARQSLIVSAMEERADYSMLDKDYCQCGGILADITGAEQNIATHALSSYIMWQATQPNPFNVFGAQMIIEGMGTIKAPQIANALQTHLKLNDTQLSFALYHSSADQQHFSTLVRLLQHPKVDCTMAASIAKCAKTVAFLYTEQLKQLDNR